MNLRKEYLDRIARTIAVWKAEIEVRGDIDLHDTHIIAEYHVQHLLNLAYGYKLENLNEKVRNQAGIDLGDYDNRIAVQVTATAQRKKIYETIEKFITHHLYEEFSELYFFILSTKGNYRANFDTRGNFEFDIRKHILDSRDLVRRINTLETPILREIVKFIERESLYKADQYNLLVALKYYPQTGLGTSFLVRVTNCGSHPITITEVFLALKSGKRISYRDLSGRYIQLSTPLPYTLYETKFNDYLFPLYHMHEISGGEIMSPLDVISVEVVDSLEQNYRFPSDSNESLRNFLELQSEIRMDWEKNDWLSTKAKQ